MKRIILAGGIIFTSLFITSCIRDGLEDCIRRIRIELDWIDTDPREDGEQLELIILSSNGEEIDTSVDEYGKYVDLATGKYTIVTWETTSNIQVSGRTLSVATNADGSALEPTLFSGGAAEAEVTLSNDNLVIPVPLHQQVRPLVIKVEFLGDTFELVEGMKGTLHGITLSRDINNGFPPVDGRNRPPALTNGIMNYTFTQENLRQDEEWFSASRNLIGVDGDAAQTLDLNIQLATGDNAELSLDVTGELIEFHTEKIHEPWYIIITIDLGINLELEIVDWIAGPDSWLTAH